MKLYTPLLGILIIFNACKKDIQPATSVVNFSFTTYETLGAFDQYGGPLYLQNPDVISPELTSFINKTLPEHTDLRKTNPGLLSAQSTADIAITRSSDVFITLVEKGTAYPDAIGFYTFPTGSAPDSVKDIKKITYIFPFVGWGSTVSPGDKVKIGKFEAGTSVGFVLLQGAYDKVTGKLNTSVPHFLSNDALNPELDKNLKKHAVLVDYSSSSEQKVLIGFEDIDRTESACDHDFNDVVLYATIK
ncbi:MAG TPA: DUF4114 domain-containing protein [Segetibacter sp.]